MTCIPPTLEGCVYIIPIHGLTYTPTMCFVSYMLFSACGHVGACRSGLFVEAMFLDIVKLNTRLNSISMLKSSV